MGALKPVIDIGSQIAGAIMGGKAIYDAVSGTDEPSFDDQLAAAESRREELELQRNRSEFNEGLKSYLRKLSRASTNYVATYHDRIEEDYKRRVEDIKDEDLNIPDPSPSSMLQDYSGRGSDRTSQKGV